MLEAKALLYLHGAMTLPVNGMRHALAMSLCPYWGYRDASTKQARDLALPCKLSLMSVWICMALTSLFASDPRKRTDL